MQYSGRRIATAENCNAQKEDEKQLKDIQEIVKGGGRLAVSLPMSVLEDRCRMWVEVKMLPK